MTPMSRGSMASPRVLKAQITDITCGENVTIIEPSNVYGCELKDDVFVGPLLRFKELGYR